MTRAIPSVMDTRQHIDYVTKLLEEAVLTKDWDLSTRLLLVLALLKQDLIIEQESIITNLRRVS